MLETTLMTKVAMLLAGCMAVGGVGAYFGRNIRTLGGFLLLAVLFIFGTIGVMVAAHASPVLGLLALGGWTFVSGLILGPALEMYREKLGWETVAGAYFGTAGVMTVCGALGAFSGIDFSFLGGILFFGLLGLVLVGFIGIFWRLSRTGSIVESLFGMAIFSGYFIFDFFRVAKESNTWEHAINLAMSLYLDFMNFFLYLLQFLAAMQDKH
jgi:FtsH-binding integral membrane protein